jgi:predicted CopG family antitoxin
MTKTISISDDVYEQLVKIKGKKSFSEVIRELIRKKGNAELIMTAFGTRSEKEAEELEKEIKEVEKWMQSLIQA